MNETASYICSAIIVGGTIVWVLIEDVPQKWWRRYAVRTLVFLAVGIEILLQSHFAWWGYVILATFLWQFYKDAMDHVKGKPD